MKIVTADTRIVPSRRIQNRRGQAILVLTLLALIMTSAIPATAQTNETELIKSLDVAGFNLVDRSESWLGRVILDFENTTTEREIIFNPVNGEVLRDYSEPLHRTEEESENWLFHLLGSLFGERGE